MQDIMYVYYQYLQENLHIYVLLYGTKFLRENCDEYSKIIVIFHILPYQIQLKIS